RSGVCLNEFLGGTPRLDLVRCRHGGITEEQNQIVTLAVGLRCGFGPGRKSRDRLLLVVLKDFEIILRQVVYVVALLVRHHRFDKDQFCFPFNDRGGLLVSRRGWRWRRSSGLLLT